MGKARTQRKNRHKRARRRVFAVLAAELQASEDAARTKEDDEVMAMQQEEARQRVHETWCRAVRESNERFEEARRRREQAERQEAARTSSTGGGVEQAVGSAVDMVNVDDQKPLDAASNDAMAGMLLAQEAQKCAYEAMRKVAASTTNHIYQPAGMLGEDTPIDHDPAALQHFQQDLHAELVRFGTIHRMELVQNRAKHLVGNVYVEYATPIAARAAWSALRLRWFAGKRVQVSLVASITLSAGICAAFLAGRCARGNRACNDLHLLPSDVSIPIERHQDQPQASPCHADILQFFAKPKRDEDRDPHHRDHKRRKRSAID